MSKRIRSIETHNTRSTDRQLCPGLSEFSPYPLTIVLSIAPHCTPWHESVLASVSPWRKLIQRVKPTLPLLRLIKADLLRFSTRTRAESGNFRLKGRKRSLEPENHGSKPRQPIFLKVVNWILDSQDPCQRMERRKCGPSVRREIPRITVYGVAECGVHLSEDVIFF